MVALLNFLKALTGLLRCWRNGWFFNGFQKPRTRVRCGYYLLDNKWFCGGLRFRHHNFLFLNNFQNYLRGNLRGNLRNNLFGGFCSRLARVTLS